MKNLVSLSSIFLLMISLSCEDCNDCKDVITKSILVLDENGNNLLFGQNAVYNPQAITLSGDNDSQPVVINEESQTLDFFLEDSIVEYTLQLDENTMEIITFDLAERESERCFGTQTFTTTTRVNGVENTSTDSIIIVK